MTYRKLISWNKRSQVGDHSTITPSTFKSPFRTDYRVKSKFRVNWEGEISDSDKTKEGCSMDRSYRKLRKLAILMPDKEVRDEFERIFGVDLMKFNDKGLSMALGRFSFDVVAFDDYCKDVLGYVEDGKTSLKDFVEQRYGQRAADLVMELLAWEPKSSSIYGSLRKKVFSKEESMKRMMKGNICRKKLSDSESDYIDYSESDYIDYNEPLDLYFYERIDKYFTEGVIREIEEIAKEVSEGIRDNPEEYEEYYDRDFGMFVYYLETYASGETVDSVLGIDIEDEKKYLYDVEDYLINIVNLRLNKKLDLPEGVNIDFGYYDGQLSLVLLIDNPFALPEEQLELFPRRW